MEKVPPFDPRQLQRQMRIDGIMRWGVAFLVGFGIAMTFYLGVSSGTAALIAIGLVVGAWLVLNLTSARVSRELPQLAATIDAEPEATEDRIAQHLRARPLLGWVRLMLYHRLAGLRHRQQRFDESLAICGSVLQYRLGPARDARAHLLLMLVEAALERRDLVSAYHALNELYQTRLSLIEALQRLALQTRYEVMAGYHTQALAGTGRKVQLAELMPASQCGAVHAILAAAATHTQQQDLANWLWQRAELLCTPDQLAELQAGGFSTGIVEAARPAQSGTGQ